MINRYLCLIFLMIGVVSCARHPKVGIEERQQAVRCQARFSIETPSRKIIGVSMISVDSDGRFFCELQTPAGLSVVLITLDGNRLEYLDLTRRCYLKTGLFQELVSRELGLAVRLQIRREWFGLMPAQEQNSARSYRTAADAMISVRWISKFSEGDGKLVIGFPNRDIRIVLTMEYFMKDDPKNCRWTFDRDRFPTCNTDRISPDIF